MKKTALRAAGFAILFSLAAPLGFAQWVETFNEAGANTPGERCGWRYWDEGVESGAPLGSVTQNVGAGVLEIHLATPGSDDSQTWISFWAGMDLDTFAGPNGVPVLSAGGAGADEGIVFTMKHTTPAYGSLDNARFFLYMGSAADMTGTEQCEAILEHHAALTPPSRLRLRVSSGWSTTGDDESPPAVACDFTSEPGALKLVLMPGLGLAKAMWKADSEPSWSNAAQVSMFVNNQAINCADVHPKFGADMFNASEPLPVASMDVDELSFDYEIPQDAPPAATPSVVPGIAVPQQFRTFTVAFSDPVTGVDAGDLLVAGAAATQVVSLSAIEYEFSGFHYPGPAPGAVETIYVVLAAGGIASPSGAYEGDTWAYDVFWPKAAVALPVATPPVIDGVIEPGEYPGLPYDNMESEILGEDPLDPFGGASDSGARFFVAQDAEYFFVAVDVTDDEILPPASWDYWMEDSIALYADYDFDRATFGNLIQAVDNAHIDNTGGVFGQSSDWYARSTEPVPAGGGYQFECKFRKATLGIDDDYVGFNLEINDKDASGIRYHYYWAVSPWNNDPWNDPASFGLVYLVDGPPVVQSVDPAPGSYVLPGGLASITVEFNLPVQGVDAGDLALKFSSSTAVADSLVRLSPWVYRFGFSNWAEPTLADTISVDLFSTGGIAMQGEPTLVFPGAAWSYDFLLSPPASAAHWTLYE